jgi:hypothetical protein
MPNRRHSGQRVSRHECEQPFAQLPLSLLGGVVLNALSIMARRVLDRLIAEHLKHGGRDNGRLHVSYRQLAQWTRANDGNIPPALAELVDLGLLVITHGERVAGSSKVAPNVYRLTFFPDHEDAASTDEWRRWEPSRGAPHGMRRRAAPVKPSRPPANGARPAWFLPYRGGGRRGDGGFPSRASTPRQG